MKGKQKAVDDRQAALQRLTKDARDMRWSSSLFALLREELGKEDDLDLATGTNNSLACVRRVHTPSMTGPLEA